MYFLAFVFPLIFKNYEIPKKLLTKIQNSVQNVYTVTHVSCDVLKHHYEIFICEIYMFMHTFYALY